MRLKDLNIELKQMLDNISGICFTYSLSTILESCIIGKKELGAPLKIAIVGITSVGKSTLLNALIKRIIVPTGAETLTYNVNVLSHVSRSPNGAECVLTHLKGGEIKEMPISSLTTLVDGRDNLNSEIRDNIIWVEAFVDYDYLKDIDLIDTPGLLSTKGKDSNNTIELFKDDIRKPDVFIYLMQRAVQESDISAVSDFQSALSNGSSSKVSGLNTIGALTHCDYLCHGDYSQDFHELGQRLLENNRKTYSQFRMCFSKTFTLAAIYAQAAYAMTKNDFGIIKQLCDTLYEPIIDDLYSKSDFIDDQTTFGSYIMLKADRADFVNRIDFSALKYSIWWVNQHPDADFEALKIQLISYSGVEEMNRYIFSKFRRLAVYFKAVKLVSSIRKSIESSRIQFADEDKLKARQQVLVICRNFEAKLHLSFSFLSVLVDYYNNAIYFTSEEWEKALSVIEECLSESPDQETLMASKSFWKDNLKYYTMIYDVEAQESCIKLINQIDITL